MEIQPIIAVVGTALLSLVVGMAWYSKYMFGKQWMDAISMDDIEIDVMRDSAASKAYILSLFSTIITTSAIALLLILTEISTPMGAVLLGGLLWVGFTATTVLGAMMWEKKSVKYLLINTTYQLLTIVGSSVVLYYWLIAP